MTDWIEFARKHFAAKQPKKPSLGVVVDSKVVPIKRPAAPVVIPKKPRS